MLCVKLLMHKNYYRKGFNDLSAFNLAMFDKQGWKFSLSTSISCFPYF